MKNILIGIIVLSIVIAGCTSAPVTGEDSTPRPPQTPTATPLSTSESTQPVPQPTVLRIWVPPQFDPESGSPAGDLLQERLNLYTAERPDLRIETRVKASSGTGGLLDSLSSANAAAPLVVPDLILLPRAGLEIAALKGLLFPFDGFYFQYS